MAGARFIVVLLVGSGVVMAGDAVSGVNGKLGYAGGSMESDCGQNVFGSFSLPLADNFGLQGDGLYTDVSDRDFYGAGGHLFWRDWDKALLGVTGGVVHEDALDSAAGGLEAEYYLDKLTLAAGLGIAGIDYDDPAPFIDTDETDFYGTFGVRYYPLDDLMLSGSYLHVFDNELVLGQVEYQTPVEGLSLFVEAARGENGYDHALFGLEFYFGESKSLIRRHREDDPPNIARQILHGIGTYGAEFNRRGRDYLESLDSESTGGSYGFGMIATTYSGLSDWAVLIPSDSPPMP